MKNAEKPAMPPQITGHGIDIFSVVSGDYGGLTKREYFAAMAMQGILSNTNFMSTVQRMSCDAVIVADALLAELEKDNG